MIFFEFVSKWAEKLKFLVSFLILIIWGYLKFGVPVSLIAVRVSPFKTDTESLSLFRNQ